MFFESMPGLDPDPKNHWGSTTSAEKKCTKTRCQKRYVIGCQTGKKHAVRGHGKESHAAVRKGPLWGKLRRQKRQSFGKCELTDNACCKKKSSPKKNGQMIKKTIMWKEMQGCQDLRLSGKETFALQMYYSIRMEFLLSNNKGYQRLLEEGWWKTFNYSIPRGRGWSSGWYGTCEMLQWAALM